MATLKKLILKIFWNVFLLIGLSYSGIFWSKEVKKMEEEFNKFLKNV